MMMSVLLTFASTMLLLVLLLILMFFTISWSRPFQGRSRSGTVGRLCKKGAYFLLLFLDLSISLIRGWLFDFSILWFFNCDLLGHLKEELIIALHLFIHTIILADICRDSLSSWGRKAALWFSCIWWQVETFAEVNMELCANLSHVQHLCCLSSWPLIQKLYGLGPLLPPSGSCWCEYFRLLHVHIPLFPP